MADKTMGFFAYPANPEEIGISIEEATTIIQQQGEVDISTWKALDIAGHFIAESVTKKIEESDFLVADISVLNFNVTYEIGFAIGKGKRVLLTKNKSISNTGISIEETGIFDTLGFTEYQNSRELSQLIRNAQTKNALNIQQKINIKAPVYLVEGLYKTDWASRIISRIKKARYLFRTFDPNEQPRLSANDAIEQVAQSHGVVVPLLSKASNSWEVHNMRCAFIAGLSVGMDKAVCTLQNGEEPVPIDYRDFVHTIHHPNEINEYIADFASHIAEAFQQDKLEISPHKETFLQSLDLGSSSAENEMRTLENYYLKTDQFFKSIRGEANIVVGRKGSGKSAIFLQIRDKERNKKSNIVLDLKPDGYKLIKFKELILSFLEEGTFQHTITAFWEYVLLLEICYKILEKDREQHIRDHTLYEPYRQLADLYHADGYDSDGDFSERMGMLIEKISSEYKSRYGEEENVRLSAQKLTELLYFHDVNTLMSQIIEYLKQKETCWLLFDNIDKGWPISGLEHEDLIIIRALIDATKKIKRKFDKSNIHVNTIVFLRNDVYELLVRETSDRGKEASVMLDWVDSDLLRELILLRIRSNDLSAGNVFLELWHKVCISHYQGEETSQYLIDRSLMRPRFLLNLISQCKGFAINFNHKAIQKEDIEKGLKVYSSDLLADIGYEINDVETGVDDILYAFISSKANLSEEQIRSTLVDFGATEESIDKIIYLLLWYGFIGVVIETEIKYIYDFNYSMKILEGLIKKNSLSYQINPAFWPALMIENDTSN